MKLTPRRVFLLMLPVALTGIVALDYNYHWGMAAHVALVLVLAALGLYLELVHAEQGSVYRDLAREILQILNEPGDMKESVSHVLAAVKQRTGFDAVGIRLRDGDDFPYAAHSGMSKGFLAAENTLIAREPGGGICRDENGKPRLACTCGMVLTAGGGKRNPFLTKGGSFWTNDSAPLLALPPEADPRLKPRNRCIHDGYATAALVPIRSKDEIVGLLHLNDRRKERLSLETVELLEGIASSIGSALMRKKLEGQVRDKEEKYRGVFECGFDPVFFIDAETFRFDSANAAALSTYGYTEKEMLTLENGALSADPAGSREKITAVAEGRSDGHFLGVRHRKKDGTEFPVEIFASRRVIAGKVKVIATVHDLTRRLRDAEASAKAAAEAALLREREKMTMALMATVSHELRTPLAAIKGFAETLRTGGLNDRKNRMDFVVTIEKHANRLSYLVEDLLLLTDLDSKSKAPAFAELDLAAFVEDCVHGLAPLIRTESASLDIEIPEGLMVRADVDRLARVVSNLLDNAFKYNRAGGRVLVTAAAEGDEAVVTVRDSGRGIPPEDLPYIFGRFYRSKTTRHIHGTGLGLSIVKSIVELHGGRIWVESVVSKGSDFRFTLPLAPRQATI